LQGFAGSRGGGFAVRFEWGVQGLDTCAIGRKRRIPPARRTWFDGGRGAGAVPDRGGAADPGRAAGEVEDGIALQPTTKKRSPTTRQTSHLAGEVRQGRATCLPGESIERERARGPVKERADVDIEVATGVGLVEPASLIRLQAVDRTQRSCVDRVSS